MDGNIDFLSRSSEQKTRARRQAQLLRANSEGIAREIVVREGFSCPALEIHHVLLGQGSYPQTIQHELSFLAEAVTYEAPELYLEYIRWRKATITVRKIHGPDLYRHLEITRKVVQQQLQEEASGPCDYISQALKRLPNMDIDIPSALNPEAPLASLAQSYLDALMEGDRRLAMRLISGAINRGANLKTIYSHVLQTTQYEVGRFWQMGKITDAQEHFCAQATELAMSVLYSRMLEQGKSKHTLLAMCVEHEMHQIGIRMLSDFFEMEGWRVICLGADVPNSSVLGALKKWHPDILAVSVTMSSNISRVDELIARVHAVDEFRSLKIMVGGYPFTIAPNLWRKIGADAFPKKFEEALDFANKSTVANLLKFEL